MLYTNVQFVLLSRFDHVFCATAFAIPKRHQSVSVLCHFFVADETGSAPLAVPVSWEVSNGVATLFGVLLSQLISALSHTTDNNDLVCHVGKQPIHRLSKARIVIEVSASGNDDTEHGFTPYNL